MEEHPTPLTKKIIILCQLAEGGDVTLNDEDTLYLNLPALVAQCVLPSTVNQN